MYRNERAPNLRALRSEEYTRLVSEIESDAVFRGAVPGAGTTPIEDYALLSDCRTAALVSKRGSIDWLCLPRLDSASVFGALLGTTEHGHWTLCPSDPNATCTHRYDSDTFILIARWETGSGVAEVHDYLAIHDTNTDADPDTRAGTQANTQDPNRTDLIRRVVGISGTVQFEQTLRFRFDYARALPWVRQIGSREHPELLAIAGPDAVLARCGQLDAAGTSHRGSFTVEAEQHRDLAITCTCRPRLRSMPRRACEPPATGGSAGRSELNMTARIGTWWSGRS